MKPFKNEKLDTIQLWVKSQVALTDDLEEFKKGLTKSDWQLFIYYRNTLDVADFDSGNIRECLDVDNFPHGGGLEFIKSLEKFDVKDITVSTQGTGLMELLDNLTSNGWEIKGMIQLVTIEDWFGDLKATNKPALKLSKQ